MCCSIVEGLSSDKMESKKEVDARHRGCVTVGTGSRQGKWSTTCGIDVGERRLISHRRLLKVWTNDPIFQKCLAGLPSDCVLQRRPKLFDITKMQ